MRSPLVFFAIPLIASLAGCADDYPSAYGRATTPPPPANGANGLWNAPLVNAIGASDAARTYYQRLPAYEAQKKPLPERPSPLKTPQELSQEEQKMSALRDQEKNKAMGTSPSLQERQQTDQELMRLRDRTRARAAAEAAD